MRTVSSLSVCTELALCCLQRAEQASSLQGEWSLSDAIVDTRIAYSCRFYLLDCQMAVSIIFCMKCVIFLNCVRVFL